MKKLFFLLFLCTTTLFAQKDLHFDTMLHYEFQSDTAKSKVIFLTSKSFPNHTAKILVTEKEASQVLIFKYDLLISLSYIEMNDFLIAENITLKSNINFDAEITDFKFKHKHYQFKEISKTPNICFEFAPTLSQRQIKKKKIKLTQVELLPNSENEIMFCDGTVLKWLIMQQAKEFQGIPSKITYFNPEDRAIASTLLLVEKIDISKNISLEKTTPMVKVVK